jgi:hypothetical protein
MGSKVHFHTTAQKYKTLKFYIDNVAVVKTTYNITPTSGQWIGKCIEQSIDKWLEEDEQWKIMISWIPMHKGIKGNKEADKLAKAASKMDTFKETSRAYALRMNKEENLREWKERWLETVRKGRFAWANRCPPAWKPPPHVHKPMKRNVFGRLIQAQIRHAHIGKYYRDFNIPQEISCPCGATIQTRIHILSECPLYDEHRHLLHDEDQNITKDFSNGDQHLTITIPT